MDKAAQVTRPHVALDGQPTGSERADAEMPLEAPFVFDGLVVTAHRELGYRIARLADLPP